MTDAFMEAALEIARLGVERGQYPFGVAVVRDGRILAKAHSTVARDGDPTAIAEVNAIRQATAFLQTRDLSGCHFYCTCEPDYLGAAAILASGASGIVFGAGRKDAHALGFDGDSLPRECFPQHFSYRGGLLWEKCFDLMKSGHEVNQEHVRTQ